MSARREVVGGALVLLVGIAVLLTLALLSGPAPTSSPVVGTTAPRLTGTTLSGHPFALRPRPGTLTIVNIWASWCGPCRDELPLLDRVARRWHGHGVQVVGINTRDGPVAARTLLHEVGATHLTTVSDPDGRLAVSWGATGVPESFVVDGHGVVRSRRIGVVTPQWLDQQLSRWGPS